MIVAILILLALMFFLLAYISFLVHEIKKNTDMMLVLAVSIMDTIEQEKSLQKQHFVH